MGKTTTRQQLAAIKTDVTGNLAAVRECVQAADGIEGLEHLAGHMRELETFVVLALRIIARTNASVVLAELQGLQTQATIASFKAPTFSVPEEVGHA